MPLGFHPQQRANPKGCQTVAGGRQAFEATSGQGFNPPLHLEKVPDIFAEYGVSGTTFGVRGKRDREPGVSLLDPRLLRGRAHSAAVRITACQMRGAMAETVAAKIAA
jgi:hypothetical protein